MNKKRRMEDFFNNNRSHEWLENLLTSQMDDVTSRWEENGAWLMRENGVCLMGIQRCIVEDCIQLLEKRLYS